MENGKRELLEQFKATLSAAGDVARQGLDMGVKKTSEVLGTAKLMWKLSEARFEARQLYLQLGKTVFFEQTTGGKGALSTEEIVTELGRRNVEIEDLKREIKLRRGGRPCPNGDCPETLRADDAFCRKCGTPFGGEKV